MPSGYLHKCCAERACALSGITPADTDAMVLGAQGPDPLFTLGMFPLSLSSRPNKLGNRLHTHRTGAFLMALCRRAKEGGNAERAYALGFLTHYALDSSVHPYVYAVSTVDGEYSSSRHMTLEKSWDTLFHRRHKRPGTPEIMPGLSETCDRWPKLAALLAMAIAEVFPEEGVTPSLMEKAFESADRANRLTHSPHGGKYALAFVLERIIGKKEMITSQMAPRRPMRGDILNVAGNEWRSPFSSETPRHESVEALIEAAVRRAGTYVDTATRFFGGEIDEEALSAVVGNLGYDTGLDSKP